MITITTDLLNTQYVDINWGVFKEIVKSEFTKLNKRSVQSVSLSFDREYIEIVLSDRITYQFSKTNNSFLIIDTINGLSVTDNLDLYNKLANLLTS